MARRSNRKHSKIDGSGSRTEGYYDLMVMRVSEGEASFNSEEQNEPINPDDCIFIAEWFEFYNEAEVDFKSRDFQFFGFVDPSLGKSKKSDFSAIITLAKHKVTGYMYVLDADIERRHPDRIITDVLEKERWLRATYGRGYKKLGAEVNQFQWFLKEELAKASARPGYIFPLRKCSRPAIRRSVTGCRAIPPTISSTTMKPS